jgi:hypothetical protein
VNDHRHLAAGSGARSLVASAWRSRWQVELEAEARFARLAGWMEEIGAAPEIVDLARRASQDERRHASLCAELARSYGEEIPSAASPVIREIAPRGLQLRGQVLYEMVASCCITETESMGVLTTLLGSARGPRLRQVLRELARDEVGHSRLGWAHLASEHAQGTTSFLGPFIPSMLEGSIDARLFSPAPAGQDDEALLEHGVLPPRLKLEVFRRTLEEVVFPGLDHLGVDVASARRWLADKLQTAGSCAVIPSGERSPSR